MTSEPGQSEGGRTIELQIDGRQLLIVVVGIVLLCAVFFHFGRRVGRSEGGADGPAGGAETRLQSSEDAAADLTFFDRVTEERGSGAPPPVASGAAPTLPPRAGAMRDAAPPPAPPAASPPKPSVAAPRTVTPPPPAAATGGGIEIQVAVVSERARADSLASRLRSKGYAAQVSPSSSGGRTVWRVRVGGYPSREAARSAAARLEHDENLKTWIPGER
jgi:cell division septation protein DedD